MIEPVCITTTPRRAGKAWWVRRATDAALARGLHAHVAEHEGTRCASDICPTGDDGFIIKPKGSDDT